MSKDRFSGHSKSYAAFRPTYPKALYDFIIDLVPSKKLAWDCACGNGQVARDLSTRFEKVYATDHSEQQISNAVRKDNISYSVAPAEKTSFSDKQFDLITVGQALHWFNIPAFFAEARRVSKPGGIVAVWGYSLLSVDPMIDPIVNHFYTEVIGSYWDPERKLVDQRYTTIDFPFQKIEVPLFDFSFEWSLEEFKGYITTWSSVQKYIKQNGIDPTDDLARKLEPIWGAQPRKVSFPLFTLVGRV
ncbi:MAG TPA: class I SAM-dependent methyltransferase [Cyclobacteriaceae bacterium]|nr:class I SAM-dependent methyltransferase [Cyclobacteriaceae bacterium]